MWSSAVALAMMAGGQFGQINRFLAPLRNAEADTTEWTKAWDSMAEQQKKLAAQFYITLQRDVESWLALGVTKTGMVYRLKGNEPQSHE